MPADAAGRRVPWERRRTIGRARAFARTAWLATAHPGRLAPLVMSGVDVRSAGRFRLIVRTTAAVGVVAAFAIVVRRLGGAELCLDLAKVSPWMPPSAVPTWTWFWSAGATIWPVLPIGGGLTLWAGTVWDHWFAIQSVPAVQRGRAMAGARYAVAPLLGVVVVAALATGVIGVDDDATSFAWIVVMRWLPLGGSVALGPAVMAVATGPARYALALPGGGAGRAAVVLAGTATQWTVAAAIGLAVWPAAVGFVVVVVDSLR